MKKIMKETLASVIFLIFIPLISEAQAYEGWEAERVECFYEKVPVKSGTLGEDGQEISCVFIPTEMKEGVYQVEIADYKNDLYEITGTSYFVKFRSYYGFAGLGEEGVLVVGKTTWSSTFYKKP